MAKIYESYMFRGKEPIIDELRTVVQQENGGKLNHKILARIEEHGGASVGASSAWFFGKTMRPQNASIESFLRAQGYHRPIRRMPPDMRDKLEAHLEAAKKKKSKKR